MIERKQFGQVPSKHHIVFRDHQQHLLYEECITRHGFDAAYTIAYHQHRPQTQRVIELNTQTFRLPQPEYPKQPLKKRHFKTQDYTQRGGTWLASRMPLMYNDDIVVSIMYPNQQDTVYFVNGDADDLYYIHEGAGVLRTVLGDLQYGPQDYVCVPRGIAHRFIPNTQVPHHVLSLECLGGLGLLKQFRNETGQLTMDAPYCHRDFIAPTFHEPRDEGIRETIVKKNNSFHAFAQNHSLLDVVGWDGSVYPFTFNILNFQPRAGLVHLPPTWHGTFATRGVLVCSFVPRKVDFHPQAIPCPYPHSSVDCDEFIFYSRGNFTSRRGVGPGGVSYHPAGIPHGPHPGAYEASIGTHDTTELAVMLDTFKTLHVSNQALELEDLNYHDSFIA